jgi:hypothetical protein
MIKGLPGIASLVRRPAAAPGSTARAEFSLRPCFPPQQRATYSHGFWHWHLPGTKADLLPEGTREGEVAEWLQAAVAFKKINAVSVHLVSVDE